MCSHFSSCGQTNRLSLNLKGLFTIFFSVRSHILNSNGVWYSWFCPEGPINASNSIFLFFILSPGDLDSQRHMGPRLAAQGTLTHSAGDLDSRRHRFPMALWVEVPCAVSQGPLRRESRSHVAPRVEVPGDKIKTQKSWVWGVYRPLRAKSPIPHPITIQNMRSDQK